MNHQLFDAGNEMLIQGNIALLAERRKHETEIVEVITSEGNFPFTLAAIQRGATLKFKLSDGLEVTCVCGANSRIFSGVGDDSMYFEIIIYPDGNQGTIIKTEIRQEWDPIENKYRYYFYQKSS